jgi:diadenylate cyclase
VPDLLSDILFLFQRLTLISLLDLILVTLVFYTVLMLVRDTQAVVILRGVILLIIMLSLLTSLVDLPAFSWLIRTALPSLFIAIPVIFAPEIRRGLERIGRAGSGTVFLRQNEAAIKAMQATIHAVVSAAARLSARQHGALIILQRTDPLQEYVRTGVHLDSKVTPELLLQIFYPNTPLHDGAAILADNRVVAGACVMPLSASGILNRSPERNRRGRFGRNRLDFYCAWRADDPPPGLRAVGKHIAGVLPAGGNHFAAAELGGAVV